MGSYYSHIVRCKPGLTGLWQVTGRNGTTFEERVKIETYYAMNNSLKSDIKILLRTFKIVLKREGAA